MANSKVLFIDAVINIILGILLLSLIPFPEQVPQFLGLPKVEHAFYPSILGAVLFGIGIALLLEIFRNNSQQFIGLGLGGAIVINLCGGAVLIGWLMFGGLILPLRGMVYLWVIALILIVISGFELMVHMRKI
jgi:hypothetical protein